MTVEALQDLENVKQWIEFYIKENQSLHQEIAKLKTALEETLIKLEEKQSKKSKEFFAFFSPSQK